MRAYLPLRDYAMIGNCRTAALVSRHGSIDWCCMPRFDSPALFCRLLDAQKGGFFRVTPTEETDVHRSYLPDSNILTTRFPAENGELLVTDFMPVPSDGANEQDDLSCARILRLLEVKEGSLEVRVSFRVGFNFGQDVPHFELTPNGCWTATASESCSFQLPGALRQSGERTYESVFRMEAGERHWLILRYGADGHPEDVTPGEAEEALSRTNGFWRNWVGQGTYHGPYSDLIKRSAIVLKSLIYQPTGALIAAPTTSLPERIGGNLNWDYRFAWLRDSGLIIDVLQRLGYHNESIHFLEWIQRLCFCSKDHLQPVYRIDGSQDLDEQELLFLDGYRHSRPVRIGNAAAKQFQLDVPGHVLEAAFLCYTRMPREVNSELWEALRDLTNLAVRNWREPDCGIWEDRSHRRHYLHSKLYCWVAVDRALRLADQFDLPGDLDRWREAREEISSMILGDGYDADLGAFRQTFDIEGSDAASLVLPQVGLLPATDERVQSTIRYIRATHSVNGLIYRRRRAEANPDDGIFLLCNFWLVDVLIDSGHREEAEEIFQQILRYGNDVGLFPEEIDPSNGEWLGNLPQGFTHLALIRSAVKLQESVKS